MRIQIGSYEAAGETRAFAEKIGIGPTVLWHFLRGGGVTSETIDAIVKYLGEPA